MDYDKIIKLNFENAGIFRKNWKQNKETRSKEDRILNQSCREKRTKDQYIEMDEYCNVTLHFSFIENVLRVLAWKRPRSKYRSKEQFLDDIFTDLSKRSFVKINSLVKNFDKKGKEYIIYEKMNTIKCLDNSWNPDIKPNWLRIKYLVSDQTYQYLINVSKSILNTSSPENILFSEVADLLYKSKDDRITTLIQMARVDKAEPLAKLLSGSSVHSLQQSGYKGLGLYLKALVTKGITNICRIDGSICIPVKNDELEMFRNGRGIASILEGGVVNIESVIDLEYTTLDFVTNGYYPVRIDT